MLKQQLFPLLKKAMDPDDFKVLTGSYFSPQTHVHVTACRKEAATTDSDVKKVPDGGLPGTKSHEMVYDPQTGFVFLFGPEFKTDSEVLGEKLYDWAQRLIGRTPATRVQPNYFKEINKHGNMVTRQPLTRKMVEEVRKLTTPLVGSD